MYSLTNISSSETVDDREARVNYTILMNLNQRIFQARKDADLTQDQLAEAVGKTRSAVAQWESGEVRPRHSTLVAIARATKVSLQWLESGVDPEIFGLPAVGEVAAGTWKEGTIEFAAHTVPVSPNPDYPAHAQRLYRVSGTSLNRIAADGSYLHAVAIGEAGIRPEVGDLVVVRRMEHGLTEYTAKRIWAIGGKRYLKPDSVDPQWEGSLIPLSGDESTEIEITDLVIAVWYPVLTQKRV